MSKKYYIVTEWNPSYIIEYFFSNQDAKDLNFILMPDAQNLNDWGADLADEILKRLDELEASTFFVENTKVPEEEILKILQKECSITFANNSKLGTPAKLSWNQILQLCLLIESRYDYPSYTALAEIHACTVRDFLNIFSSDVKYEVQSFGTTRNKGTTCFRYGICPTTLPAEKVGWLADLFTYQGILAVASLAPYEESELPPLEPTFFGPIHLLSRDWIEPDPIICKQKCLPNINPNEIEVVTAKDYDRLISKSF